MSKEPNTTNTSPPKAEENSDETLPNEPKSAEGEGLGSSKEETTHDEFDNEDNLPRPDHEELHRPMQTLLEEVSKFSPNPIQTYPATEMDDFEEWAEDAYCMGILTAVREHNVPLLRQWLQEDRLLEAANKYGESVLHLACRRGFIDVVAFYLEEAEMDLWIRDDAGRTPLHDAFWTPEPCYELVDYMLEWDHDLLFVVDKRGNAPLDYARKVFWCDWLDHFKKKDLQELLPLREVFYKKQNNEGPSPQKEDSIPEGK